MDFKESRAHVTYCTKSNWIDSVLYTCRFSLSLLSLLSEELAAAVENLVMLPNMSGVSEVSRDSGSSEAVHDYAEIYTPSREGMNWLQGSGQGPRPPTPPLHRFPSWEAKIYQVTTTSLSPPKTIWKLYKVHFTIIKILKDNKIQDNKISILLIW